MENISVRRLAISLCSLVFLLGAFSDCQRKTETAAAPSSPTPSPAASRAANAVASPSFTGPITPALVKQEAGSITQYLHYPKDPDVAKLEGAVQFYCDVTETGAVESTQALVGTNDAFKAAVQIALDWGRFTPATVNGQPVPVYLGGTVLFLHQHNEEVIVVSLATHDRDRVRKFENYIQPQLIGGLRHLMEQAMSSLTQDIPDGGRAEVVVSVNDKGAVTGTSGISESPKDSGLGALLEGAVKKAQFTPAYENGKPAAGGIDVVADFGQF
ncbi:MAG: energy transducer TonB [Chthoniobacterales bacterium]